MRATIYTKGPGGKQHLKHCTFTDEVWADLRRDWLAYLEAGKPTGGAYPYVSGEQGEKSPRELLLKFEEIAAIT